MKLSLPIDSHIDAILAQLSASKNLVLIAEPGAGKTTRLPAALANMYKNKILVLEPRRVAALAAADRIATENNWRLGNEVGYRVRFDSQLSHQTRLIFMTEALLTRQLLDDPDLNNVDVVVLDEFHERSLHVDLALGLLREMQELGHDFKIIVMSATLEAEKISEYLGAAPIVRVPGKLFDLKIEWLEKSLRPVTDQMFYSTLVNKIQIAMAAADGDALVFLPGVGEIIRTSERLEDWARRSNFELVTLHGTLNLEDPRRALRPSHSRRIILATNIAESSLTVDGVNIVVDSGLAKIMRQDISTGFSRLELTRISASSAKQRSGRAARQTPGFSFRLWSKGEESSLKKDDVAEILRSDLSESLLYLAAFGVANADQFTWFEKPSMVALKKAREELLELKAITEDGAITQYGRLMSQLPLSPRWAHFLLSCAQHQQVEDGCLLSALSQERDIVRDAERTAEIYAGDNLENDLFLRLQLLNDRNNVNARAAKQVEMVAERLAQTLSRLRIEVGEPLPIETIVLKTFANRLCRRRGKTERALMVGGRGVKLAPTSIVRTSEFFIAFQASDFGSSRDTTVNQAFGFSREQIVSALEIEDREELAFDDEKGRLFLKKQMCFRDLPIEEPRLAPAPAAQSEAQLALFLANHLDYVKKHNDAFAHWLDRFKKYSIIQKVDIEPSFLEAFQMAASAETRLDQVIAKDLCYFLESLLPEDLVRDFNKSAPEIFIAPTGSRFKIHYPQDRSPYVEVRLQELFGVKVNPKVLGDVPLQFHLLGPNYRPQQVTSDIASFWQNTYPEVRKELRIRYPKHSWPEDPLTAVAVKKGQSHKR